MAARIDMIVKSKLAATDPPTKGALEEHPHAIVK
jgi:hypothetical protein